MSEIDQEPVPQDENNFEYNENEMQNDQNHEEDIENQEDELNNLNAEEEVAQAEGNEANQEENNQQYFAEEERTNEFNHAHEEEEDHLENPENDYEHQEGGDQLENEPEQHDFQPEEHVELEEEEQEHESEHVDEHADEHADEQIDEHANEQIDEQVDEQIDENANENGEKDISEMTNEELRRELEDSISQLDFVRAQSIQDEIKNRSTQNHSQLLDEYAQKFTDACNEILQQHHKEKRRLQKKYLKTEIKEREMMSDGFNELKKSHIDQLQKLENDLFNVYKDRMTKPIAAYDELIERAKNTARRGDFSSAQDYQHQAAFAKADEEKKREDLFKEDYKAKMTALLDKQTQEISDFAVRSNNAINKLLKTRDEDIADENERFKRAMNRKYRETCDSITHSRYNPRDPTKRAIDPKAKPSLLNIIEDTYNFLLVKFGLQTEGNSQKPRLIAPNIRPESKMSVRMQSRVENRESEKKKKDEEQLNKARARNSSRSASRSGSKQTSPNKTTSPRSNYSNTNNSRRSPFSPSKLE